MANVWFVAALWVGLALVATLLAIWPMIANAFLMPSRLIKDRTLMETVEAVADGAA
jgi:hypothetical protein